MSSGELAPGLETVESLLENHSLPLLVQRRSGDRLLLNKLVRIPYVVCQQLDHPQGKQNLPPRPHKVADEDFFLIPLNNKGFYGAVSSHDEPTLPYTNLSQILLHHQVGSNPSDNLHSSTDALTRADRSNSRINLDQIDTIEVLCDNVTPIREYDKGNKKFIHKVLLPGDTVSLPSHPHSCPLLETKSSSSGGLCCFRSSVPDISAEHTICIRDKHRHIHIDRYIEGRFYIVKHGQVDIMESGTVYSLSDVTRHQGLPRVVSSISAKQTAKDEVPLPNVFRMISVMSDRVIVGYKLSDRSEPRGEDQIELSSYSSELYAIAESSRVDMSNIRDHQPIMSIRRAIPGVTISTEDLEAIILRSGHLPPKLPSRPPTLRLRSDSQPKFTVIPALSVFSGAQEDLDKYNSEQRASYSNQSENKKKRDYSSDNRSFVITEKPSPGDKVVSPTRYSDDKSYKTRSLPRSKLDSSIQHSSNSSAQTVRLPTRDTSNRSILRKFSSVTMRVAGSKRHPSMKSILENFNNKKDNDLSSELQLRKKSAKKKSLRGLEIVHVLPDAQPDEVDIADAAVATPEKIKQSSSCSEVSSDDGQRLDDFIQDHYQFLDNQRDTSSHYSTHTPSQRSSQTQSSSQRSSIANQPSSIRNSVETTAVYRDNDKTNRRQSVRFSTQSAATITIGDSDNDSLSESDKVVGMTGADRIPTPDYNQNDKQPVSHLDEIKLRFAKSSSGGLKSPTEKTSNKLHKSFEPQLSVRKSQPGTPTDPVSELKLKFSSVEVSDNLTSPTKLSGPKSFPSSPQSHDSEDPYLLPVTRPLSAKIRISP